MVRIAIVEDDQACADILLEYLARYEKESGTGIQCTRFEDGEDIAVDYKAQYDIILMDVEMQFMDGMSAAEEIRKVDEEVTIIFITNMTNMFHSCSSLETIPLLNTSKVTSGYNMFNSCASLKTIPKLNFESMTNISSFLSGANNVVNIGGFENLGAAYLTTAAADYSYYRLDLRDCSKLTHESLMNVINNLYDIKTKGCKAQSLRLGATNLAKLSEDEIAIAQNKGWNVS